MTKNVINLSPLSLFIICLFLTSIFVSNIIGVKLVEINFINRISFPAALIIFPISYLVGDILTEVYGYRLTRVVIWYGLICNFIAVGAIWIGQILPPDSSWKLQTSYENILGHTPKLFLAGLIAYLVGEFSNSYVMAKMKLATKGRWLWTRTIGSTMVGQGLDSFIFITIAFYGAISFDKIRELILTQWIIKTAYETFFTPLTYVVVGFLKRYEESDVYDYGTDFNPFLSIKGFFKLIKGKLK
jgi:queuosine precursor transporter